MAATAAEWSPDRAEIEARRLLNDWVRAQNGGDFKAFAELYADRFEGTSRRDKTTVRFDRETWIRDRTSARPTQVRLFFLETQPAGDSVEASFVQVSGADPAPEAWARAMTLGRFGDRYLIVAEQMTALRRLQADPRATIAAGYFRLYEGNEVVLWEGNVAPSWLPRKLEVKRSRRRAEGSTWMDVRVEADAPWKPLPEALSRWRGRQVQLVSATDACSAQLDRPVVSKQWSGPSSLFESATDDEVARALTDDQLESWTLHAAVPDCQLRGAAVFARFDQGPVPRRAPSRRPSRPVAAEAIARFKKLPQWPMISTGGTGSLRSAEMDMAVATGRVHLVAIAYESATPGCGTWAIWQLDGGRATQSWQLLNDPGDLTYFYPELAVDLDGDGKPEIFGTSMPGTEGMGLLHESWSASGAQPLGGHLFVPWEHGRCGE